MKRLTIIVNALTDNDIDPGEAQAIAGGIAARLVGDHRLGAGVHITECLGAAQDLTLVEWSDADAAATNLHALGDDAAKRGMTTLADQLHDQAAAYDEVAERIQLDLVARGIEP